MAKKPNTWGTEIGLDDGTKKTIPVYNGALGDYRNDPGYSASQNYYKPETIKDPEKPTYMQNNMAYPTYAPSAAQYSYSKAAPTWNWNDSGRPGDWNWNEERPEYASQYQDQINKMVANILNRPQFAYDYNQDPLYQQYAEAYTRNGRQAMNDTLAQVSARTGGLASSYAGTASQQAYNSYMDALNDKIPELQQIAYNMYMNEGNNMRSNLSMLQGLEDTDYGRYMDALGQWNTDRNFSYGQYQDLWNRYYNDRDFSYGQYQDALSQYNTDRNWDYNIWSDNLARSDAARKAAYQSQVAAYNARQKEVDAYNRQQDAAYQAALKAAQDQRSAQEEKYRQQNQANATTVTTNANGYQWNGQNYKTLSALQNAIDAADITDSQWQAIKRSMLQNHVLTDEEYSRLFG